MSPYPPLDRRRFLALGLIAVPGLHALATDTESASTRFSAPARERGSSALLLTPLQYGQVQFRDGPLAQQARENHLRVMGLDEDSLLLPFRLRSGLSAPGQDLGGWYGTYAFAPGATFGQWVSALSRYHALTGEAATRAKVVRLVQGYAATLDAQGSFYQNNRFPAYTYDKLIGGLLDAQSLAGDPAAREILARTTRIAVPYLPPKAIARNEHAHPPQDFTEHAWDESYTLPENQFLAWRMSGDAVHLQLARRFLYDEFFSALARGENALPGKHAYSHVNALSSAAQAYLSLDAPLYKEATRNGFDFLTAQSFATGGWGPDEHFVVPGSGALGKSLDAENKSFETPCGAYAHLKLTRYLLGITADSRYGDSMERMLYNTVLGALPLQADGHAFYYSDYTRRAKKTFHPDRWPCCSGTLPMVAADYAISACFTDRAGLYVNLYAPAEITWTQHEQRCALSIATDYPYAATVAVTLRTPSALRFALNFRIPAWAQGASLRINGERSAAALEPGRFARIEREWRNGDRIELDLPLELRLESVDAQHPDTVALIAGPLVLMRLHGESATPLPRLSLMSAQRQPGTHEWRVPGHTSVRLMPFVDIGAQHYSAYQDVLPS